MRVRGIMVAITIPWRPRDWSICTEIHLGGDMEGVLLNKILTVLNINCIILCQMAFIRRRLGVVSKQTRYLDFEDSEDKFE